MPDKFVFTDGAKDLALFLQHRLSLETIRLALQAARFPVCKSKSTLSDHLKEWNANEQCGLSGVMSTPSQQEFVQGTSALPHRPDFLKPAASATFQLHGQDVPRIDAQSMEATKFSSEMGFEIAEEDIAMATNTNRALLPTRNFNWTPGNPPLDSTSLEIANGLKDGALSLSNTVYQQMPPHRHSAEPALVQNERDPNLDIIDSYLNMNDPRTTTAHYTPFPYDNSNRSFGYPTLDPTSFRVASDVKVGMVAPVVTAYDQVGPSQTSMGPSHANLVDGPSVIAGELPHSHRMAVERDYPRGTAHWDPTDAANFSSADYDNSINFSPEEEQQYSMMIQPSGFIAPAISSRNMTSETITNPTTPLTTTYKFPPSSFRPNGKARALQAPLEDSDFSAQRTESGYWSDNRGSIITNGFDNQHLSIQLSQPFTPSGYLIADTSGSPYENQILNPSGNPPTRMQDAGTYETECFPDSAANDAFEASDDPHVDSDHYGTQSQAIYENSSAGIYTWPDLETHIISEEPHLQNTLEALPIRSLPSRANIDPSLHCAVRPDEPGFYLQIQKRHKHQISDEMGNQPRKKTNILNQSTNL